MQEANQREMKALKKMDKEIERVKQLEDKLRSGSVKAEQAVKAIEEIRKTFMKYNEEIPLQVEYLKGIEMLQKEMKERDANALADQLQQEREEMQKIRDEQDEYKVREKIRTR